MRLSKIRPIFYFVIILSLAICWSSLAITSVPSIPLRIAIGAFLGMAIGVMAFRVGELAFNRYVIAALSGIFWVLSSTIFVVASETASWGTLIVDSAIAAVLFIVLSRKNR